MRNISIIVLLFLSIIVCQAQNDPATTTPVGLDWLPEQKDIQAGAILVPENHEDPNGKKIQITYIILKAKDTISMAFPMIFFAGGPGGNALSEGMINFLSERKWSLDSRNSSR